MEEKGARKKKPKPRMRFLEGNKIKFVFSSKTKKI